MIVNLVLVVTLLIYNFCDISFRNKCFLKKLLVNEEPIFQVKKKWDYADKNTRKLFRKIVSATKSCFINVLKIFKNIFWFLKFLKIKCVFQKCKQLARNYWLFFFFSVVQWKNFSSRWPLNS